MRFLIHGAVKPEAGAALVQQEHACHTLAELLDGAGAAADDGGEPKALLQRLEKRQWNLLTTDRELVNRVYENKIPFVGVIVLILDDPEAPADQGQAVARLFERYKRLTPRRL